METTATIPPGVFLIILAITVAISLAAGYFARLLEERQKPAAQSSLEQPPVEKVLLPEEHTALKVTLDKNLAWQLEVDGARITPTEISAEQRARLVNILVQIRPWIDGKAAPAQPVPAPAPPVAPAPTPLKPASVATTTQPPVDGTGVEKPKIDVLRGLRSLVSNDLKNLENARPASIVEMIDDFLQKRLAASSLAGQDIHLEEGSLGEVVVFIGKNRFPGVDAVPDPQIQGMIRAAIKDWEKNS